MSSWICLVKELEGETIFRKILNVLPPYLRFLPFSRPKIERVPGDFGWIFTPKSIELGEISRFWGIWAPEFNFRAQTRPLENGFFSIFGFGEFFEKNFFRPKNFFHLENLKLWGFHLEKPHNFLFHLEKPHNFLFHLEKPHNFFISFGKTP